MSAAAYLADGYALIGRKDHAGAIAAFKGALAAAPGDVQARYGLGMALAIGERHAEALAILEGLVGVYPEPMQLFVNIGMVHHQAGRMREAVTAWGAAMAAQAELAVARGLDRSKLRYLGSPWLMAIGHIAHLDFFAKRQALGLSPAKRHAIYREGAIANPAYLKLWAKHFEIVDDPSLAPDVRLLEDYPTVARVNSAWRWLLDAYCLVQEAWDAQGREPLISLPPDRIDAGRDAMAMLGLPREAWFATLHVRDDQTGLRTGRNASLADYLPAIQRVIAHGGCVVRIGAPPETPSPVDDWLIDYPRSAIRADWLDIYLISQCRFFIGTNSGPAWAAMTFGVPTLLTNCAPIGVRSPFANSVMIPQLLRRVGDGALVPFAEHFGSPAAHVEAPRRLAELGLEPIANTPEEIAAGVEEMLAGSVPWGDRQDRFDELSKEAGLIGRGVVSASFLAQHAHLL